MTSDASGRCRLRDLGLVIGALPTGPLNAITDVSDVRVGHVTIIADEPRVVRTGVTAVVAQRGPLWETSLFAGFDRYNGFGEVAGTHWIAETGMLSSPIVLTSSFSMGLARDVLLAMPFAAGIQQRWHQPCVGETNDGALNDWSGAAVTPDLIASAIADSVPGPVAEGAVGGGTGMISFEFKAGIGTASRQVRAAGQMFTVGALVQANFGDRSQLTVDGVPVGRHLPCELRSRPAEVENSQGSIVVILATDAPLLPPQLTRIARRAEIGLSRAGGYGYNRSGDFILALSTANELPFQQMGLVRGLTMLGNEEMNSLFPAAAEATEEAILNSMTTAGPMTGARGTTVPALPLPELVEIMRLYGRGPGT